MKDGSLTSLQQQASPLTYEMYGMEEYLTLCGMEE
jgi:hypothetical protein